MIFVAYEIIQSIDLAGAKSGAPGAGCSEPDPVNPKQAKIWIEFCNFAVSFLFILFGLLFLIIFNYTENQWPKSSEKKNCIQKSFILRLTFNPGFTLSDFRITLSWLQQLTRYEPTIQSKPNTWLAVTLQKHMTSMCSKPELAVWSDVILVSEYHVFTGVNWLQHDCLISKIYAEKYVLVCKLKYLFSSPESRFNSF